MRVAFLAKRHSIHTVRWVNTLAARGHEVHLISSIHDGEKLHEQVRFHPLPFPPPAGFFLNALALRRLLKDIQPEILNTHFASGYGTLARLSGFHPNVLSVWGSDVYDFPRKSVFHSWLIRRNLKHADWVSSTSHAMANQAQTLYSPKNLSVVPFGIDTDAFKPTLSESTDNTITIGTVKTLAPKYGIDTLLRAFAQLRNTLGTDNPEMAAQLRLLIVGGGVDELPLKQLARDLGVENETHFSGYVPHQEVTAHLQRLDIYVALSRLDSESFGVAVLEASACGLPVVVSNVGGLPEVVEDGHTGIVVPRDNASAAASALAILVTDEQLRTRMGQAGRLHVEQHYTWKASVDLMEAVYRKTLDLGLGPQ